MYDKYYMLYYNVINWQYNIQYIVNRYSEWIPNRFPKH